MTHKVLIDIGHIAQYNFYRKFIENNPDYNLCISYIDRGVIEKIILKEIGHLKHCSFHKIGKHGHNKWSVIWHANILRFFKLLFLFYKQKPEIQIGNGYLAGLVAKFYGIPSVQFGDDPEAKDFRLKKFTASELFYANIKIDGCKTLNAPKEWSYLTPKYFIPNPEVLNEMSLPKKGYYFIREVSTGTLNYSDQRADMILSISDKIKSEYKIVLSLEDKSNEILYPSDWQILKEPVTDIHSLIFYSRALFSTGDSMTREAALLGVESYYCGTRDMKANRKVMDKGRLHQISTDKISQVISQIDKKEIIGLSQENYRAALEQEYDDVNQVIGFLVTKYLN